MDDAKPEGLPERVFLCLDSESEFRGVLDLPWRPAKSGFFGTSRRRSRGSVTHYLRELGEVRVAPHGSLEAIAERAEELTPFAWVFRYPGEPQEPSPEEAGEALAIARQAYESVLAHLQAVGRP
jgi:hypothetical protein